MLLLEYLFSVDYKQKDWENNSNLSFILGQPDCSCTDFVNPDGIGYCKKAYHCGSLDDPKCVKKFYGKYLCYVNQPTNCEDVFNSQFNKAKKASAVACEKNKGWK